MSEVLIVDGFSEIGGVKHATGMVVPKTTLDAEVKKALSDWSSVFRIDLLSAHPDDTDFILSTRDMAFEGAVERAYAKSNGERKAVRLDDPKYIPDLGIIYL